MIKISTWKNYAIFIAGFMLVSYIILLICIGSYGQIQLIDSRNQELKLNVEKEEKNLEYFFASIKDQVFNITKNKSINAYFSNKALGMSMKYGLRASIVKIDKYLQTLANEKKMANVSIFKEITVLDIDKQIVSSTNKKTTINTFTFHDVKYKEPYLFVKETYINETSIEVDIVIEQIIYNGDKEVGKVIAIVDINSVLNSLTKGNYKFILSTQYGFISDSTNLSKAFNNLEHISVPLKNAPLSLIGYLALDDGFEVLTSRWFIFALVFLAFPVFIAIYYLVKFHNNNIRLNTEIALSKKQQDTLNEHNILLLSEVKKRKDSEDRMFYQANYDMLTLLPNRFLFMDRLKQTIIQAQRNSMKVAILFIDLDNFKHINDSLGHIAGDIVLKEVSDRLQKCIRKGDTVSRLGGDEFTIILSELEDTNVVATLSQKVIKAIEKEMNVFKKKLFVTSSVGISIFPNDGNNADILLRNADSAMYKAKDDGKNNYKFYTKDMTSRAFEYLEMESSFRESLENKEFSLYYQPQFDARTDKVIGLEALVRWKNQENGMIPPSEFIPIAEKSGFIIPLGQQILEMAIRQIAIWKASYGLEGIKVAINLSVKQIEQYNMKDIIVALLEMYSCKAEWIELEITEGYIMNNPEVAIKTLYSLKELGISISIDDFGTGYSSLSYLKKLPIDKLKIDQSFVRDLVNDEDDRTIIEAIISLSNSMHLEVIAEGVEELEQKEFLMSKGCNLIQGFLYSFPLPAEEVEKIFT